MCERVLTCSLAIMAGVRPCHIRWHRCWCCNYQRSWTSWSCSCSCSCSCGQM